MAQSQAPQRQHGQSCTGTWKSPLPVGGAALARPPLEAVVIVTQTSVRVWICEEVGMYRSRRQIEKKLRQTKYMYKQISKFKNRYS